MTVEFVPKVVELPITGIRVIERLRPTSEDAVLVLLKSIQDYGFTSRILVRRTPKNGDVLLDGAHRIEAARRAGMTSIPVQVVTCRDDEAVLLEADANLVGADLSILDEAVFLAARRRAHQTAHPEVKQGLAGAKARWEAVNTSSLASVLAEKRSISVRQVYKIMAAGEKLGPDEVRKLRAAPKPVTLSDLQVIAKIGPAPERYAVVTALAEGQAPSAAKALAQFKDAKPARDPNSAAQEKIAAVWSRAPMAAKRAFAADHADELRRLLAELEAE